MPPDDKTILSFLEMHERKMLEKMAEKSGRSPLNELKWLIQRRALGHLKDLGDDRGNYRLYENDLRSVHVEDVELGL